MSQTRCSQKLGRGWLQMRPGGQGGQGGQGGPGCQGGQCGPDVHKSCDGVVFRWPRLDLLRDCQINFDSTIEYIRTAF